MQDEKLKVIARDLTDRIKTRASLDWTQRETVRADMRRTVRRLLARYGYPPDAEEAATRLITSAGRTDGGARSVRLTTRFAVRRPSVWRTWWRADG